MLFTAPSGNKMLQKIEEPEFKGILTQRGMLPLKDGNIIFYSDGVSHKL